MAQSYKPQALIGRLLECFGNPLEWSRVDRCLLAVGTIGPFMLIGQISAVHELASPALPAAPVIDFTRKLADWTELLTVAWGLLALAGWRLRTRAPDSNAFVHVSAQLYAVTFALICYLYGPTTSVVLGLAVIAGAVGGLLLFSLRPTFSSLATFFVLLVASDVAAFEGVIPYAPFAETLRLAYGERSQRWLVRSWIGAGLATLMATALFNYILARWRDREQKLAQAAKLIQRYVPAQLAEGILAGDFSAKERPVRRTLTIFFSDIKGFTGVTERLDPDRLSHVLNEYLTEMARIAHKHGGTVDKFVGDAVMVFFGAPRATNPKDHALRAVQMALEMQRRMLFLRAKWFDEGIETPFEIRVGIDTGPVHVGNFGSEDRMDYTVIGHHVNLASRLESNCSPGEILISEATYELIQNEIPCEAKGEIQAKGISKPVKVYEVITA